MDDHEIQEAYRQVTARQERGAACLSADDLDRLARRDAPDERLVEGLDHVMACPHCLREFELLRAVQAAARSEPSSARFGPRGKAWLAAAVLVLAVGTALVAPRFRNRGSAIDPSRGADSAVVLIEPIATALGGAPIRFAWHPVPEALGYEVEVLDDTDQPIASATVSDTVWVPADSVRLVPGKTYRWWVAATTRAGAEIRAVPQPFTIREP